ncbi:MAG TPA: AAA family ATPase [Ktedonobacterales bacterium]|jgi:DNA-binding CsgD family transcriptional regulator|nr:AAA family ATPase [Ktedonobacterales bacterium]
MTTDLLERDHELAILHALLSEVSAGQGRIALISGEAGIGKTALVERFVTESRERHSSLRVLEGACEALFAPRPLGPLYDIAQQTNSSLGTLLDGEMNRATLFAAVLDELAHAPTVLVIEDVHWADEATLDLIKYLARRISRTRALLILTYRDEELSRDHPLRLVLGDLPVREAMRVQLLPLSEVAVAALARRRKSGRSARLLYAATGGNPFFLTETLASEAPDVPTSVSDAVLARVARRSPEAQRLLETVAVSPGRIERWVVTALDVGDEAALDECLAAGMLHLDGQMIAFRHELARQAVEGALPPARRQSLNARVLHALLEGESEPASLARLAHHATQADDPALVLRFAPDAARQAAMQSAHREAAAHYATALRYAGGLPPVQRADLLEKHSYECYLTGQFAEALAASEGALAIWRAADETEKVGHNLRWLSRLSWFLGQRADAERYGAEAIRLLELLPPSHELAMALSNMAQLAMLHEDVTGARRWGGRAIALADALQDREILTHALNNVGTAELLANDARGHARLTRSLSVALEHGFEEHAARAYINLASGYEQRHRHEMAAVYVEEGLAYCAEHDLEAWGRYLLGVRATASFRHGDWHSASEDAAVILKVQSASKPSRLQAWIVTAWVRVRRGDPGAAALLDEALEVALKTAEIQRIGPLYVARAEMAWLRGDHAQCQAEAHAGYLLARQHTNEWIRGELAYWRWRAGGPAEPPEQVAEPFALSMTGDWRGAASAWEALESSYEQALALLDGDEAAQRQALGIFERLGAAPAVEIARQRLRAIGAHGLPRGPRPATQANPYGLTPRQLEILLLLAEGLHNTEIAERLSTTPKTVEHHITAILAKLNARSRVEAVRLAYESGLIPHSATTPSTS